MALWACCRQIEMVENHGQFEDWTWYARITFVCQYTDARTIWKPSPLPPFSERLKDSVKSIFWGCLFLFMGVGCGYACFSSVELWEELGCRWICVRFVLWGFCLVNLIMFVDCYYWVSLYLLGFASYSGFDAPFTATSLAAFWGKRWNKEVQCLLHRNVHSRLVSQYGKELAAHCTFAASGILHVTPLAAALLSSEVSLWFTLAACGSTFLFFVLQGYLVAIQKKMGVKTWPSWLGWVCTMLALVMTTPLATEPYYLVFRPHYGFRCLPQMTHIVGEGVGEVVGEGVIEGVGGG